MKSNVRVGFLSILDPFDKRAWSGTHYRMKNSLESEFEHVKIIAPIASKKYINTMVRGIDKIHRILFNKKFNKHQNMIISLHNAKQLRNKLKDVDVLFVPSSSTLLPFLNTTIPICTFEDATFDLLLDYYPNYSSFSKLAITESKYVFKRSVKKATFSIYSSNWAANSAKQIYGLSNKQVFEVGFGPNIDVIPERKDVLNKDFTKTINILFLAKDWSRKGGEIVIETFHTLLKQGMDVSLTICGCIPPKNYPEVSVIPFLNKNLNEDLKKFNEIIAQTHLLFVPTRADCTPIVFCEAAAYGIPVLTTDTGGVSSIIEDGANGYSMPYDSEIENYVSRIKFLMNDVSLFKRMSESSRSKFEKELNWQCWGKKMKEILIKASKKYS